jgi:hypothetical protein
MKINEKLSEIGFSEDTINSLTESQVDQLLSLLLGESKKENKEATTKIETTKVTEYQPTEVQTMMKQGQGVNVDNGEVTPTAGGGLKVLQKSGKSEAPKGKVIKDGEMSEGKKKKKSKYNPWAICTSSVGRKDMEKYERCVMDVKESIKEGKNPYEVILEDRFEKILLNNLNARITKKDFVSLLETKSKDMMTSAPLIAKPRMNRPIGRLMFGKGEMSETETAPAKPKVKPDTETRPRPSHPGRNPKPGEGPAPAKAKVKKIETKEVSNTQMQRKKDEFMSAINKILKK